MEDGSNCPCISVFPLNKQRSGGHPIIILSRGNKDNDFDDFGDVLEFVDL
jgi:hypothetical protein